MANGHDDRSTPAVAGAPRDKDVPESMEVLMESHRESSGAGYTERVGPAPFFCGCHAGQHEVEHGEYIDDRLDPRLRKNRFQRSVVGGSPLGDILWKFRPVSRLASQPLSLSRHGAQQSQAALAAFLDLAHQGRSLLGLVVGKLTLRCTRSNGDIAQGIAKLVHPVVAFRPQAFGRNAHLFSGFGIGATGDHR